MEAFTGGLVTGRQRKFYISTHEFMKDSPHMPKFYYRGHGKYLMIGWESQIARARWIE